MKKILALILATLTLVTLMAGCKGDTQNESSSQVEESSSQVQESSGATSNPTPKEVMDAILAENQIQMGMEMTDEEAQYVFNLNLTEDVESYAINGTMANVAVDNIAVVVAKEGKVENVVKSLTDKRDLTIQNFEQYLPDKYEIAKKGKVFSIGNYVFLVIHENVDAIEAKIREMVK